MRCAFCGEPAPTGQKIFRNSLCAKCEHDLKTCQNCAFFCVGAHWDCRETIEAAVRDKDRANFCDFFSPAPDKAVGAPDRKDKEKSSDARDRFSKLFGA
jgi:hypothetical protein